MQVTPYLYFKGSCEAALNHYEACGLVKITELKRYIGTPMAEREGAAWADKVLHSVFEGPQLRLCASDGPDSEPMKGCAIYLEVTDVDVTTKLFNAGDLPAFFEWHRDAMGERVFSGLDVIVWTRETARFWAFHHEGVFARR